MVGFHQHAAQCAFLGAAQVGGKQLRDGIAVLLPQIATLPRDDLQAPFVHQSGHSFRDKQQVTLHQADGDCGGDGREYANAGGVGDGLLAPLLLLRGPRRGIGIRVVVFCITMAVRRHWVYSRVDENRAIKSQPKESEHAKGDSLEKSDQANRDGDVIG